jgi:dihydroorotase
MNAGEMARTPSHAAARGSSFVTVLRGARHWRTGRTIDLAWRDGVLLESVPADAERTIEARGAMVAPGLVDVHVHLREPGQSAKETVATGTRAAAAGGFTDVLAMPNTNPPIDDPQRVTWLIARAAEGAFCRVHPIAAVTVGQQGERLAEAIALRDAGAVALSDDGRPILSAAIMRRALEYASAAGLPVIAHEEDLSLKGDGHMNEGAVATRLGIRGIPSAAEAVMVRRDVELAALTGGRLHVAHVSCAESVAAIRDAKSRGLRVSAETCPHYWTLTDEAVGEYDTNAKMNPPLRAEGDRRAIVDAIADGTIDCLATDHAPHTLDEKRQLFDVAPFGIVGLETALALTITHLVEPGHLTLARAIELWTDAPRRLFGLRPARLLPGEPADLVLFDPAAHWRIDRERFFGKGRNTPFHGHEVSGRVLLTACDGEITHQASELHIQGGAIVPLEASA